MMMSKKSLKICAWNINGFFSRIIGNKFLDQDFAKVVGEIDLLCLTETHIYKDISENLSIPGFQLLGYKNHKKNSKSNTAQGGIAIFAKSKVANLLQS